MPPYDDKHIQRLIQLELLGGLSPGEKSELKSWADESEEHRTLLRKIKKELNADEISSFLQTDVENAWGKVRAKTFGAHPATPGIARKWLKYVAVVLPLALSLALWYTWRGQEEITDTPTARLSPVLTLDNGEEFQLGSAEMQAEIAIDEGVKARQVGGSLVYDTAALVKKECFNHLKVPRGCEYQIVLSDGTRVWLNAATELKYPVAFNTKERGVYLKGEAYFEVAPDKNRPFYVETDEVKVRVLGTAFNVNTHHTRGVRTVLAEGAVALEWGNQKEIRMQPGELADYDRTNATVAVKKVDAASYTSWKDGHFVFENETLEEIMHTLALWYDKEPFFMGQQSRALHFSGHVKRYERIETILSAITEMTGVEFQTKGRTILIQ